MFAKFQIKKVEFIDHKVCERKKLKRKFCSVLEIQAKSKCRKFCSDTRNMSETLKNINDVQNRSVVLTKACGHTNFSIEKSESSKRLFANVFASAALSFLNIISAHTSTINLYRTPSVGYTTCF